MHHDHVPAALADHVAFVREMKVEATAAARLERHVVVETGLLRERLEQRRHATDAFAVQVGHGSRPDRTGRASPAA